MKESQGYHVHYVQTGQVTISKAEELICAVVCCSVTLFQILSSLKYLTLSVLVTVS